MGRAESELFAGCHWLYLTGMRSAIRERLVALDGNRWWTYGIMRGMQGDGVMLTPMEKLLRDRPSLAGDVEALDTAAIRQILYWNYERAFNGLLGSKQRAYNQLGRITGVRNNWAHGRRFTASQMLYALDIMIDALAMMNRGEAMEIKDMKAQYAVTMDGRAIDEECEEIVDGEDDAEADDIRDVRDSAVASWRDVWGDLRDLLAFETKIEEREDNRGQMVVNVRVTNVAETYEDLPNVRFLDIRVGVGNASIAHASVLEPGQAVEGRHTCLPTEVAGVRFVIEAWIDKDSMLQVRQLGHFPAALIDSALEAFVADFDKLGMGSFLETCAAYMDRFGAEMTFAEASEARGEIDAIVDMCGAKLKSLGELSRTYGLGLNESAKRGHPFGEDCADIVKLVAEFRNNLQGLDDAIGATDMALVEGVVEGLRQQQLAVMRLEAGIRARKGMR